MDLTNVVTSVAFWFDIACVIVLFAFCARYVRLGFISAVLQIFGTIISLVGAHAFATRVDTWVYETFFEKALCSKVETIVVENGERGMQAISERVLSLLPESVIELWPEKFAALTDFSGISDVDRIVQFIMDSAVAPIVTQIIFMVLFLIGFIVCRILVYWLVKACCMVNYIPVVGSINRILGWVVGTVGGVVDLYLVFCVLWLFILLTDGSMPVLNTVDLADSYCFRLFQMYNLFV